MPTPAARKPAARTAARPAAARPAARRSESSSTPGTRTTDAIALLKADHKEVKDLFKAYEKLVKSEAGDDEKLAVARQICTALTVHAAIEEELFYPDARDSLPEADLVDEAVVEHATVKDLIAQIEAMEPSDALYDAKVKVLGEYIDHHVKEEEEEMFPKVRKTGLDLKALGEALASRKEELLTEVQGEPA